MTNYEFLEKLKLAVNSKTLYVKGAFGAPAGYGNNKTRYSNNYDYNKQADRKKKILTASNDTFFFDCVCLGKGILWGWNANVNAVYGGASYLSNGVPDFGCSSVEKYCTTYSHDMTDNIEIGEWLYCDGHTAYYAGNGLIIESSPNLNDGVHYNNLANRKFDGHGKIKFLDYTTPVPPVHKTITCPCCGAVFAKV